MWLLVLLLASRTPPVNGEASNSNDEEDSYDANMEGSGVVTLTSTNFEKHVGDGNAWLVEFYAPW